MDDAVSVDKQLPPRDTPDQTSMRAEIEELKAQQVYLSRRVAMLASSP